MKSLIEGIPLIVFLVSARFIDPSLPENWLMPFAVSAILSVSIIFVMKKKRYIFNRVFLGINIYLIIGFLAFILKQYWLTQVYSNMKASGMLVGVIFTGIISTIFSRKGFIGIDHPNSRLITKYSTILIVIAIAVTPISYTFQESRIMAEVIPFSSIFIALNILRNLADKKLTNPKVRT